MATEWLTEKCPRANCNGTLYLDDTLRSHERRYKCSLCSREWGEAELKRELESLKDKLRGRQI
ncbi:hypothetical protein ASJ33_05520 [Dehalococcoides mccartyi]|uniref:hypothetical protein n=1 Tax=Dehalococcoides mccartyi TaxID=61435 RepID=UPI00090C559D|nr:hypothetical protein [Dehalococcoides mccartyi]APH12648.1 hypothetical protein ASJ33_05520 [Dehalococcoides mccartyi]